MSDAEELAMSREVLGEVGPHVRAAAPRVLAEAHTVVSTHHTGLDLQSEDAYGLIWLKLPKLLISEFRGLAGVQIMRPFRARFEVPVINGVPLVGWRYAKSATVDVDRVPFGRPVSQTRRSLFEPLPQAAQMEIELGQAGLGDRVVAELPEVDREQVARFSAAMRELAGDGSRVAVLAFASNPSAVLRAYFGYADLGGDDHLRWTFRRELPLPLATGSTPAGSTPAGSTVPSPRTAPEVPGSVTGVTGVAGVAGESFDSGPMAAPVLRPRRKSDSS